MENGPKLLEPIELLRAPEEEVAIRNELKTGTEPRYIFERHDEEKSILVYGTPHFFRDEEKSVQLKKSLEVGCPDILLVEGSNWEKAISEMGQKTDEELLLQYGEEAYAAVQAKRMNIPIESWDLGPDEQLVETLKQFSQDEFFGWAIGQSAKHIIDQGKPVTVDTVRAMLKLFITPEVEQRCVEAGIKIHVSDIDIEAVAHKELGQPLSQLSTESVEPFVSPAQKGKVIRAMNELRDKHAIRALKKAKERYSKIFVTCGRSHAITWEPAIEAIYPEKHK